MSIQKIKEESGFTILEILIALLILAGGLMGAAAMQTRAVEEGVLANRMTRRITAAEDRMEDLFIKDILPTSENLDPFYKYNAALEPVDGDLYVDDTSPYYRVEYQAFGGDPTEMLITVRVTVIPKAEGGTENVEKRTIELSYIRSIRYR